ncbi:non-hydrolyzing UDP-N-acetylglucosamine 2-epimerase [Chloroflexota bacterium]
MKIVSVIGARPQFIKCSVLSREIRKKHQEIIIHTGQHYDYEMDKLFFDELQIPEPDYNLEVGSGTHGYQTGEMLKKLEQVLIQEKPNLVLVYGDTNSTLAGALAAAKLQIRLGHVEAGLRSFDKSMPEEINRVLTDHCSDLLFCPTQTAAKNLKNEHISCGIYITGDVMADALLYAREVAERSGILEELGLRSKEYLVATIHRQGNVDNQRNLSAIVDTLCRIDETVVFPVHPRTEKSLKQFKLYRKLKGKVKVLKPLGYVEFIKLLSNSKRVITDSGGIQKEAYILKVPCITVRETTEWVETVKNGWNVLTGVDIERITKMAREFQPCGEQKNVFGHNASKKICVAIDAFNPEKA